jgi:hypothetical protein
MTALEAINRRMGRDTVFDAGAGIHRDWQAFATPAMSILPELRCMRSGSWATTRAKPGLPARIRFLGNCLEPSLTLRKTGLRNCLSFQLQEGHPHPTITDEIGSTRQGCDPAPDEISIRIHAG